MIAPPRPPRWGVALAWLACTVILPGWLLVGAMAGAGDVLVTWWQMTRETWRGGAS